MGRYKQYTQERIESILNGHDTARSAAKAAGMNYNTLLTHIHNLGMQSPGSTPGFQNANSKSSDAELFDAVLKHNGITSKAATELGVTKTALESRLGRNLELAHRLYLALEKQKKP
jgi:hypothetical protein